jgi:hypothetical protein
MKISNLLVFVTILIGITSNQGQSLGDAANQNIAFQSADSSLNDAFLWARDRALAFAHEEDPVGAWYEAALPNREAFCMRDVAHQSSGAAALGLNEHNLNMLHKFAENINESRDYCSFWEINRYDQPAPVDYINDNDFWYNLPANFDVMQACWQQFLWTGDSNYLLDPVFREFYSLTVNEYVARWQLDLPDLMSRDRLINLQYPHSPDSSFFYDKRGIPTYNEGGRGPTNYGIDLTAALFAGYNTYGQILSFQGANKRANEYFQKSREIQKLLEDYWWDESKKMYRSVLYEDGSFDHFTVGSNQAFLIYLLHFGILEKPERIHLILDRYQSFQDDLIVELASYLPLYYYQFGFGQDANKLIKRLADKSNDRRDYPEISFAIIEAVSKGLMGITADSRSKLISTISSLPAEAEWAKLENISIFDGWLSIEHVQKKSSVLTNSTQSEVTWKACFYGDLKTLMVDDVPVEAMQEADRYGQPFSYIFIPVAPGHSIEVNVP